MEKTLSALCLYAAMGMLSLCNADTITLDNEIRTYASLSNATVIMTGTSELHLTHSSTPMTGCVIHLNSPDAWLFFSNLRPSAVNTETYLNQIRVNGAAAVLNSTVRIVQYEVGTVVIPHGPNYQPLQVYNGIHFNGTAMNLGVYTYHRDSQLGAMNNAISSFRLKRGYMATFAQESDGSGVGKVYVADRRDLEIGLMSPDLDNTVSFVRVFPWRWTSKKGWAGGAYEAGMVDSAWRYDWDNAGQSTLNIEYVPMRHNANWNSYSNINNKQNVTHALGFNEPDKSDQANMTVDQALGQWPNLTASGLRLGSPAPSDASSGLDWLYAFIDEADARNYRVDFVAVHFYKNNWTASQMYNWLRSIHLRTGRPVWITEWNNGCNWTTPHPTYEQNAAKISELITMLDSAPFVERYSIYQWCTNRELIKDGSLTPAGIVYRDSLSPMAVSRDTNHECIGCWRLDEQTGTLAEDLSGRQNYGVLKNGLSFDTNSVLAPLGYGLRLDGVDDYVELPAGFDEFDNGFSMSFWAYPTAVKNWARFIDLGNGPSNDNIIVTREGTTNHLAVRIYEGGSAGSLVRASDAIELNKAQFFAVTVSNRSSNNVKIYKNGQLIQTGTTAIPRSIWRTANYIGRSNWSADSYYQGSLDDIRVFDYALSESEVTKIYLATATQPFGGAAAIVPGRVEAEHFDQGVQGAAYFDTTTGNSGGAYRTDTDVDIRSINDGSSGYAVCQIEAGEWLKYTVNVAQTANYLLYFRAAAAEDNIPVHLLLNNQLIASFTVDNSGSMDAFQTVIIPDVPLTAGESQLLKLEFPVGGLEVNWFEFVQPGPWNDQPHSIPGRILAEEYDMGGPTCRPTLIPLSVNQRTFPMIGCDIASITDGIAGYAIDQIETGEWLKYTVTCTAAQTEVFARVASTQAGGQIHFLLDDQWIATLEVPNTGSLTTWQTISAPSLPLPERENAILTVEFSGTGFQLDWFHFTSRMPYGASPHAIPGRIEFEDYDIGGQFISFYDRTDTNGYRQYRPDEPVDIMRVNDGSTAYVVFAEAGEWLEYTTSVQPGFYTLIVRTSSPYTAPQMTLLLGEQTLATFSLPATGGFYNFEDTAVPNVYLPGGDEQILRVVLNTSTALLNYIDFVREYNSADLTQNGRVDLDDFAVLAAQWLSAPAVPSADIAPPNGDGIVDGLDLLIMIENWLME